MVMGHGGARLLADLADLDLAVMLADGGVAISDLAVLRDQADLFGPVAVRSDPWRLLSDMD